MKTISIYLAGNIQKGHESESGLFWAEEHIQLLNKLVAPIKIIFLNPALRTDDLSDQLSVFGRDMTQVFVSDIVMVDARERRGLGVGAEMMWAKMHSIPVITWAPTNSHYRKQEVALLGQKVPNWCHPFVESLSDFIVENMQQAAEAIRKTIDTGISPKNSQSIQQAMQYYQKNQFEKDMPMKELVHSEDFLIDRMEKIQKKPISSLAN